MSDLRPYKFVVQAVVQTVDDKSDSVTGEQTTEPVTLFGCEALRDWAESFPTMLDEAKETIQ